MIFTTAFLPAALLAVGIPSAFAKQLNTRATHSVTVGGEAGPQFEPEWIEAAPGDVITFDILATRHSVTQSTFEKPCVSKPGGADSGLRTNTQSVPGKEVFEYTVTDDKPQWFYCVVGDHCLQGMVFAINPGSEQEFAAFKQVAMGEAPPDLTSSPVDTPTASPTDEKSGSPSESATGSLAESTTTVEEATATTPTNSTDSATASDLKSGTSTTAASSTVAVSTGAASMDNVPRRALAGLVGAAGLAWALF